MGIYTVMERALPSSFKGVFDPTDRQTIFFFLFLFFQKIKKIKKKNNESVNHEIVSVRFLYFSTAVMSTCGYFNHFYLFVFFHFFF
jgi:hypothetical protein